MLWHARLCAAVFTAADIKLRSPLLPTVSSLFSTKELIFAAIIGITITIKIIIPFHLPNLHSDDLSNLHYV